MKLLKKSAALLLAAVFFVSAAGCSGGDKSWAMQDGSAKLPVGCYIYNLYVAYQQADSEKKDTSKAILDQQIENKDAKTWIRDTAFTATKTLLLVDRKMSAMKLSLTDAEKKNVDSLNASAWSQYSSEMEKYGVAQSSFNKAYGELIYKEQKLFDAIYGKGGTKAVPDSELKDYYVKNYTDFSYLVCPLYKTDSNGNYSSSFTDAQKKEAKKPIDDYAAQIKAGKMTVEQAAAAYKTKLKSSEEQLHTDSINVATDTNYPEAFRTALKSMKAGEVKAVDLTDEQTYALLYKGDAAKKADSTVASATDRANLLYSYKGEEFTEGLRKEADALKDVTVNDAALNSYDPKMFA